MPSEMLDFSRRAHLSELMDAPSTYAEFRDCLRDLKKVNRAAFAYRLCWRDWSSSQKPTAVHCMFWMFAIA